VAITDHHDVAFIDFIREAAANETDDSGQPLTDNQRLVVFPGVELTLSAPCQALLLLDADFPPDRLPAVLTALSIEPEPAASASAAAPQQLGHIQDFKTLYELLDRHAWLKGRYVVFPHAADGGHGTLIRKGFHEKYKEMPCVGVYTDGEASKLGKGSAKILSGGDKAWGNKRVAVMQTSDARTESFASLGKSATWIKWAVPTAEALRQACLAQESRISLSLPPLPNTFLTRLSVSNSKYMGPIDLELNPQYNAIIGGRGTGKSTCLEYIRWALCDQPPAAAASDDLPDVSRRERLIEETLRPLKGTVDVHFSINAIPHIVRRSSENGEVSLKVGDEEFVSAKPDDIRSLLPIQAYSQRQLSSVAIRLDEVTRFVTAPVRAELSGLESQAAGVAARIRENYATLQRHRALTAGIARDEIELRSLQEQASNLRSSLPDLSEEDQALLAKKPSFDAAEELVSGWETDLESASSLLAETRRELEGLLDGVAEVTEDIPEQATVEALAHATREVLQAVKQSLADAAQTVHDRRAPSGQIAKNREKWRKAHEAFETAYALAKQRSAAHESQLEQLGELEQRQKKVRQQLASQRDEVKRIGDPARKHKELRDEWLKAQHRKSELLNKQCDVMTKLSGGLIRARLGRGTEVEGLAQKFRGAISGSGIRANKIDAIFDRVRDADDALDAWIEATDELEQFVLAKDDPGAKTWSPKSALAALTATEVEKLRAKLSPEDVIELSLTPPADRPSFEYQIRQSEYIPFEVASAGQQATALLRVLLRQPGPPLIIDQPEDDLDSQVMLDVVDDIWTAKTKRQLVFSSHNANLVVNGDAEQVVCCDNRAAGDQSRGQIKLTGAIDMPKVRTEITTVMEGGEKAFILRKEKYGF